jgi:hypothetical protein
VGGASSLDGLKPLFQEAAGPLSRFELRVD